MAGNMVVFGAGIGLGSAVAHRFGREGYRVGLVGRRQSRLREVATKLELAGIDSEVFPADLSRPDDAPGLVAAIVERMGEIDVIDYGPLAGDQQFHAAHSLHVRTQQELLDLFYLTPLAIFGAVLPGMLQRASGAILVTQGSTAVDPIPGMSGVGPAMAAMNNYIATLFGEVADRGVYAGSLTVRGAVRGSELHTLLHRAGRMPPGTDALDPDDIAEHLWNMLTDRTSPLSEFPPRA
jgi:NADP-dependent 3-hydroxy acid dehydrogenase YdfG